MADSKVSDLTAVGDAPSATDVLYIVSSATSKSITVSNFMEYLNNLVVDEGGCIVTANGYPIWS
ncbi:MAG: hypothetical protein GY841_16095 [FCB group bacterium]|nr:hypothetical protein [FCB group bacterium]